MTETLAYGYSLESTQRELSNEYQHDRVWMVFKNLCILVLWTHIASVLEGLMGEKGCFSYLRSSWPWVQPTLGSGSRYPGHRASVGTNPQGSSTRVGIALRAGLSCWNWSCHYSTNLKWNKNNSRNTAECVSMFQQMPVIRGWAVCGASNKIHWHENRH